MGAIATEIGLDFKLARRIGLLHDIGKAIDHQIEGTHAKIGADLARKFNESAEVVHAIEAHHEEAEAAPLDDRPLRLRGVGDDRRRDDTAEEAAASPHEKISLNESDFRFMLNEDAMATEKTAHGIRAFSADIVKLEKLIEGML